jgi:hypothetical protein
MAGGLAGSDPQACRVRPTNCRGKDLSLPRMTPQAEARYALGFGVSRDDLSPDVQAAYDQLLAYRSEHPSSPLPVMPSVIPDVYITRTGLGLITRVMGVTFPCLVLSGAASAVGGTFWLFLIIFWLPGMALVLVLHRARLTTSGDVLTYQVLSHARAWHREEIAAFGLAIRPWSRGWAAHLIMDTLAGGHVAFWPIDASLRTERDELYGWVVALNDWLAAADDPSRG